MVHTLATEKWLNYETALVLCAARRDSSGIDQNNPTSRRFDNCGVAWLTSRKVTLRSVIV